MVGLLEVAQSTLVSDSRARQIHVQLFSDRRVNLVRGFWFIIAGALAGCAYAGTDDLAEKGTLRVLNIKGQAAPLADCLTTQLDKDDVRGIKVTRSRTLANGAVELQAGHYEVPQVLMWTAMFTQVGQESTRVNLMTRNFAYITLSGNDIAARIQNILAQCSAR
ncbi:hypothetical protein KXR53_25815 [Inquilinus limosus]|uniref:hypothetical protein n=1 Tax=Inquilinus limosus TaxID=171674 RepID=UPI003F183E08